MSAYLGAVFLVLGYGLDAILVLLLKVLGGHHRHCENTEKHDQDRQEALFRAHQQNTTDHCQAQEPSTGKGEDDRDHAEGGEDTSGDAEPP